MTLQDRRTFIKKILQMGGAAAAGFLLKSRAGAFVSSADDAAVSNLIVVEGDPEKAVAKVFELLGGIEKWIRPDDTVLLKPNAAFPNPKAWGSTTSPEVVRAVAKMAVQAGASRVIVADYTMQDGILCFDRTGLTEALSGIDRCKVLPLQQESFFIETAVSNGKALKSVKIAKLVERSKILINIPCAKSHAATDVSFGLKNLMGLIWDRKYLHEGTDLHTAIAELATIIRPQITILDATRALLTGGPTGPGKIQVLRTIVAGTDPLAVDAYAVSLGNWNNRSMTARSIKHLAHAHALGVGEIDLKKIKVQKVQV